MTKKIITSYTALLAIATLLTGAGSALASEVTGNLSSGDTSDVATSGNLSGTVTSDNGGSSSGGGRRSSLSNAPSSQTFGASVSSIQAPGFPNAGTAPDENPASQSPWSVLVKILRNLFSF